MAKILKFRKPGVFSKLKRSIGVKVSPTKTMVTVTVALAVIGAALFAKFRAMESAYAANSKNIITCKNPHIIDGDTLRCDAIKIRLKGIDTPEMPGHCRTGRTCVNGDPHEASRHLKSISRGKIVCIGSEKDSYGRTLARCKNQESIDLSCAMIKSGHAVRRYGYIPC